MSINNELDKLFENSLKKNPDLEGKIKGSIPYIVGKPFLTYQL
jgi:hypothetical protein